MKTIIVGQKFDNQFWQFIRWPRVCGGSGLIPVSANGNLKKALPERKQGAPVTTNVGNGVEIRAHNCENNFWYTEGYLVNKIFYRK